MHPLGFVTGPRRLDGRRGFAMDGNPVALGNKLQRLEPRDILGFIQQLKEFRDLLASVERSAKRGVFYLGRRPVDIVGKKIKQARNIAISEFCVAVLY